MRYFHLAILFALLTINGYVVELINVATGDAYEIFDQSGVAATLLAAVIGATFALLTVRQEVRPYLRLYLTNWRAALRGVLVIAAWTLVWLLGVCLVIAAAGRLTIGDGATAEEALPVLRAVIPGLLFGYFIAIPEELLFRGFVFRYLRWDASAGVTIGAVIISALFFAAAHKFSDPLGWFEREEIQLFIGLFCLGILLAVALLVTGSLWAPIAIHATLVSFVVVAIRNDVVDLDLSPWWLGNADDIRRAPLIWAAFLAASFALLASRKWLNRLAIEKPFVGIPLREEKAPSRAG
jgi:membrane protease YdiL (CAAX protease family)